MSCARAFCVLISVFFFFHSVRAEEFPRIEIFTGYSFLGADSSMNAGPNSFQGYYYGEPSKLFGGLNSTLPLFHSMTNPEGVLKASGFELSATCNIKKWLGIDIAYHRYVSEQVLNSDYQFLAYKDEGASIWTIVETPIDPNEGFPIAPLLYETNNKAESSSAASSFGTANVSNDILLIGPRFNWRTKSRFTPFVRVQLGIERIQKKDFILKYSFSADDREYDNAEHLTIRQTRSVEGAIAGDHTNYGFLFSMGGGIDWRINKRLSVRFLQADYLAARHRFSYKYEDNFVSDISNYSYAIVPELIDYDVNGNPVYAYYNKETREWAVNAGKRSFSYKVPNQFLNHLKLSAGLVWKF